MKILLEASTIKSVLFLFSGLLWCLLLLRLTLRRLCVVFGWVNKTLKQKKGFYRIISVCLDFLFIGLLDEEEQPQEQKEKEEGNPAALEDEPQLEKKKERKKSFSFLVRLSIVFYSFLFLLLCYLLRSSGLGQVFLSLTLSLSLLLASSPRGALLLTMTILFWWCSLLFLHANMTSNVQHNNNNNQDSNGWFDIWGDARGNPYHHNKEWRSSFMGERAVAGHTEPMHSYSIYHDHVTLVDEQYFQPGLDHWQRLKLDLPFFLPTHHENENNPHPNVLISVGNHFHFVGKENRFQQIILLGEENFIRHVILDCHLHKHHPANHCLVLRERNNDFDQVQLNVTLYEEKDGERTAVVLPLLSLSGDEEHHKIERTCEEIKQSIIAQVQELLTDVTAWSDDVMVMCLADGDVSDQNQTLQESVYHYQNQHNSALQSFVKEMPLPVKMSWRLPSRFYQLQLFFSVCGGRIEWMGSAVASLLQQVWSSPLRQAAFEQTYAFIVWSYQTICELTVLGWESIQTLWDVELFRFLLEELKEFCLGVSQSLLHMLATVGRGIGYLWHLEWCVVQGILRQSYHLIQLLTRHLPLRQLAVVPVSLGKIVLWGVEQAAYIVVPSLHTVLWRIPKQLFLLDIQVDLKILSAVTVHLRVVSHALLQVLWEVFQRVSNVVLVGLRYYHETSFTTLHVASVLQTILLGMALRQDMRDLMLAEEEEARRRRQFRLDNVENMLNQAKESLLHRHVAEPLTSNRFVRRLNGIRLFIQAHRKTSMQYIIHHFIGFVSLLGLWVLPLSGKLYYFVLLYVVPYYSTKDFLSFFFHTTDSNGTPLPPPLAYTLVVFILRAVLTTIFQHTISALLYRILRELFIFIVLLIVLVVVQWAWPRRKEIQEKVTEVIAATPAKIRSSLSSPQTSATRRADMRTPQEEETPITAPLEYEEEKEKEEATPQDVSRALNDNNNEKEEEETAEEKQQVEDDKEETHASPELAPPLFSEETEPPTLAEEPPQEEEENETPADNEKKDDTEKEEAAEEAASETVEHNDASNNNTESENKPDE